MARSTVLKAVQEQEKGWIALVSGHEQIVYDPDQGCLCTMSGAKTRLECFIETV